MNVNCVYESVFVPESTGTNLGGFDPAVDAFGGVITPLQNDRIEDSIYVIFYQFGCFFHRFQSAAHGPAEPFHPVLVCPPPGFIMPYRFRAVSLIAQARAVRRVRGAWNAFFMDRFGGRYESQIFPSRPHLIPTLAEFFVLLSPHLISQMLGDMEPVKADLLVGMGKAGLGCMNLRRPPIHL